MIWPFRQARRAPEIPNALAHWISADVKASVHAGGVVFLHRTRGEVFASNGIGARIWRGSGEGKSVERIAAEISREFGVAEPLVERDVREFLGELESAGILVCRSASTAA